MEVQDFARHYAALTDEELLRLALTPDQLTDDAMLALNAELGIRRLATPEHLANFREQETERKREIARNTGEFFLRPYGIGRVRFGKAERKTDSESGLEEFTTTLFVVLFWLPLIPSGTYRVRLLSTRGFLRRDIRVIDRLPLNWAQVWRVWATAAGCIALLIAALYLLVRFT